MQLKRTNLNDKITDTIDDFNDNWEVIEEEVGKKADGLLVTNLVTNGNFDLDSNADGLADGFTIASTLPHTELVNENVQRMNINGNGTGYFILSNGSVENSTDIIYFSCFVKTDLQNIRITVGNSLVSTPILNNETWKIYSLSSVKGNRSRLEVFGTGLTEGYIETKYWTAINLTATFGAGNEPTKEEMDALVEITGYIDDEYILSNLELVNWLLSLIRNNTLAITALGGTI